MDNKQAYNGLILEVTVEEKLDRSIIIHRFNEVVDLEKQGTDREQEVMDKITDFLIKLEKAYRPLPVNRGEVSPRC